MVAIILNKIISNSEVTAIYRSRKAISTGVISLGLSGLLAGIIVADYIFLDFNYFRLFFHPLLLFVIWLLLSSWYKTFYKLTQTHLICRSGIFYASIEIARIKKIYIDKYLWVGFKPGLAWNGITIKYRLSSEIYISPENQDDLIARLLELNPKIEIVPAVSKK